MNGDPYLQLRALRPKGMTDVQVAQCCIPDAISRHVLAHNIARLLSAWDLFGGHFQRMQQRALTSIEIRHQTELREVPSHVHFRPVRGRKGLVQALEKLVNVVDDVRCPFILVATVLFAHRVHDAVIGLWVIHQRPATKHDVDWQKRRQTTRPRARTGARDLSCRTAMLYRE
jgi:hypothetical protein